MIKEKYVNLKVILNRTKMLLFVLILGLETSSVYATSQLIDYEYRERLEFFQLIQVIFFFLGLCLFLVLLKKLFKKIRNKDSSDISSKKNIVTHSIKSLIVFILYIGISFLMLTAISHYYVGADRSSSGPDPMLFRLGGG